MINIFIIEMASATCKMLMVLCTNIKNVVVV